MEVIVINKHKILRLIGSIALLITLTALFSITSVSAAGEVSVSINSPEAVDKDNYFIALVEIGSVSQLNADQFDVVFDPSVLSLESISSGQMSDGTALPVMSNEIGPGEFRIVNSMGLGTVSGEGYLAKLNFLAVKSGTSEINLVGGVLSGFSGNIPATWTGTSIVVNSTESDTVASGTQPSSQPAGTATGGDIVSSGGVSTTGTDTGVVDSSAETGTGTVSEEPTSGAVSGNQDAVSVSELEYEYSSNDDAAQSSETLNGGSVNKESVSQENTADKDDMVKWPVIWGIIGGVVIITGILVYAPIKRVFLR